MWLQFERYGQEVGVEVSGPITLDDQDLMVDAALQGPGLAHVARGRAQRRIASGALLSCVEEWCVDETLFSITPAGALFQRDYAHRSSYSRLDKTNTRGILLAL